MADENLSGVPPSVTLSGLNAGAPNIGGTSAPGMSGAPEASGGFLPGMEGGMDLNQLSQLLQQQGGASQLSAAGPINQSLAQGSFGQQQGGLGAGSFGQSQPGYVAGQSAMGANPAQQAAQGSADPFSILQKFLGVAQKGAGAFGSGVNTASPTQADMTGSDPAAAAAQRAGERQDFTASPTVPSDLGSEQQFPGESAGSQYGGVYQQFPGENMGELGSLYSGGGAGAGIGDVNTLGASTSPGGGFTTGTGGTPGGDTNWTGAAGGVAGAGGGLLGILQGMQGGNAGQAAGGGIQTASGLAQILKSSPELAQSLGITPDMLGGGGAALQGLAAALNLYQGIQSGDPAQIGQAGVGAAGAASQGASALGYGGAATQALGTYLPLVGAVLQGLTMDMSYKNADAAAKQAMMASAMSAVMFALNGNPVTGMIAPVLGVAMAANQAFNPKTNYDLQKISGQVGPNATSALGSGAGLFKGLDYSTADTNTLMQALTGGANSLMPQYGSEGAGLGTSGSQTGSSRYIEGLKTADPAAYAQYQANNEGVQGGMANTINELMRRGMSYEDLGKLPVSGDWAQGSLMAGNTPYEMMMRNYDTPAPGQTESRWAEGDRLGYSSNFNAAASGSLGSDALGDPFGLSEVLGSAMLGPDSATHASSLMTAMYGGPLWAALARTGAGGDQNLMNLINQHFDPWAMARTWDPAARQQHYADEAAAQHPVTQPDPYGGSPGGM